MFKVKTILILLLAFNIATKAQTGKLVGKIVDGKTDRRAHV